MLILLDQQDISSNGVALAVPPDQLSSPLSPTPAFSKREEKSALSKRMYGAGKLRDGASHTNTGGRPPVIIAPKKAVHEQSTLFVTPWRLTSNNVFNRHIEDTMYTQFLQEPHFSAKSEQQKRDFLQKEVQNFIKEKRDRHGSISPYDLDSYISLRK